MKKLLTSEDTKMQAILSNDYEYLGIKKPSVAEEEELKPDPEPQQADEEATKKK